MIHICIDAPDRLGKNSLIEGLCKYFNYDNVMVRHFSKPPTNNITDAWEFQNKAFINEGKLVLDLQEIDNNPNQYYETKLIWNRTPSGEYIWGQLYRGIDKSFISDYINKYEQTFLSHKNTYLINLYASPQFCAQHEDGKSLGKTIDDKKKQLDLFEEMYNLSNIQNKLRISVEEANRFKTKEDILKDVISFIKNTK